MDHFATYFRFFLLVYVLVNLLLLGSCNDGSHGPEPSGSNAFTITVNPNNTHQEMIGFGGALTWYSNWLTANSNKNQIYDLIFDDLGIDIIRFKTWYYPDGYPAVTGTMSMADDNSKAHWDATNELYQAAKSKNPDVKVLLSSWGPPAALKSNNSTRQGTLKKDENGNFMYDAYADYWEHTLDNLPFNPDYISIQNEPTYTNAGWTTCQWSSIELEDLPDYNIAFDKVYDKIKNKANPPVMIGPESQDIPTYAPFANILKDKPHCGVLAYHPYNINASASQEQIIAGLQTIGNLSAKPNLMTEFSDNITGWFNTVRFIQNCLVHANSSGYIYWKLVWAAPTGGNHDAAMVSVSNSSGSYSITPYYYAVKHFARHIDYGYQRTDASTANVNLSVSAFINPTGDKVTVIILNTATGQIRVDFAVTGKTVAGLEASQSIEGSYYQNVEPSDGNVLVVPGQSITTVVLTLS